jgi:hypothetical protein
VLQRYAAGGKSKNPTARGDTWLSPNWSIGPSITPHFSVDALKVGK